MLDIVEQVANNVIGPHTNDTAKSDVAPWFPESRLNLQTADSNTMISVNDKMSASLFSSSHHDLKEITNHKCNFW